MPMQDSRIPALTDPVCGAPISVASPYSCVRAGAMFCFCSEGCRTRFLANPMNFVVISRPESQTPDPVSAPAPVKECGNRAPQATAGQAGKPSSPDIERWLGGNGLRGLISSRLNAWAERRHAVRASRELLATYRTVCAQYPGLGDREHYRLVIMSRTGCASLAADLVLESASESFAEWPVRRELTLCDVVHYLSISEFLAAHRGEHWMHSDIKNIVASCIPGDFCIERKIGVHAPQYDLQT